MTTLVLLGLGYLTALAFILAILATAKRGDEDVARRRAEDLAASGVRDPVQLELPGLAGEGDTDAPWVFAHAPSAVAEDDVVGARDAPRPIGNPAS